VKIDSALEKYLKTEILPQIAVPPYGTIQGTRLSTKMPVYLLQDTISNSMVVSKAFQYGDVPLESAWKRATNEYDSLKLAREKFNMDHGDYQVITPLGINRDLAALLVISYAQGNTLDHYITRSIINNETDKLYTKLHKLARFLAKLHRNSESSIQVSPDIARKYLKKLLNSLSKSFLSNDERNYLKELASLWWNRPETFLDREVMVHGDATTTNFLFYHDKVIGIDLEKAKWADRCWDLGFIAAELKHHFLLCDKSSWESEPFITHFLTEYSTSFQEPGMFRNVTHRLPLYMSLGLLRISRNEWLVEKHRRNLLEEAMLCLKYKP
jgi:thiamine kinase-like enzyme